MSYEQADYAKILNNSVPAIKSVLPKQMVEQAERIIRVSLLQLWLASAKDANLMECTPQSVLAAVTKAARLGLPIDGQMAYYVPYKYTFDGNAIYEAELQLDYKGIVTVVRRFKWVKDVYASLVYEGDIFKQTYRGPVAELNHEIPNDPLRSTKPIIGAFAIILHQDGYWHHEWIDKAGLDVIKSMSKAPDKAWKKFEGEMCKKAVLRRLLKMYMDVEGEMSAVLEETDITLDEETPKQTVLPKGALTDETPQNADFLFGTQREKQVEPLPQKKVAEKRDAVPEPIENPDDSADSGAGSSPEMPAHLLNKPWVNDRLQEINIATKSNAESVMNKLVTEFMAEDPGNPDCLEFWPVILETAVRKVAKVCAAAELPRIFKKLENWQSKLGPIHNRIMLAFGEDSKR